MTDILTDESRDALIDYRLSKADLALDDAEFSARGGRYVMAVDRLYYACYYAASALLLKSCLDCSNHKGVKSMLFLHFVVPGKLDRKLVKSYTLLFNSRQSGDYEDFVDSDADDYASLRPEAEKFIAAVKNLITES
jgi:uncharacterized protein (UPF0332 family)